MAILNKRTTTTLLASTLVGVAALMVACQPPPKPRNPNSGGDDKRTTAKSLFVGQNVTDSISDPAGDHTDWKTIRIREAGDMTVTVAIDSTRGMDGSIAVKDGFGVELERRPINASDNIYTFDRIPVNQGDFFVVVDIFSGESTYTAGVAFEPLQKAQVEQLKPLEDEEVVNSTGTRPRGPRNPVRKKDPPREETPKEDPPTEEPPTEEPGKKTYVVGGYIVRVIPRDDGGTIVHMQLSGEGYEYVGSGTKGKIAKIGQAVVVSRRNGKFAIGSTSADSEDCKTHKNVTFTVKN